MVFDLEAVEKSFLGCFFVTFFVMLFGNGACGCNWICV